MIFVLTIALAKLSSRSGQPDIRGGHGAGCSNSFNRLRTLHLSRAKNYINFMALAFAVSWWYTRGTRSTFIMWRWNQPFLDRSPWSLPRLKQHNPLLFQTMSWAPGQLDFVICSIVMDFTFIARCNEM